MGCFYGLQEWSVDVQNNGTSSRQGQSVEEGWALFFIYADTLQGDS
jgi:hypothetical protein